MGIEMLKTGWVDDIKWQNLKKKTAVPEWKCLRAFI